MIPLHVLDAANQSNVVRNITVCSPDTDVFILLLDLFARNRIAGELTFKTGKGKLERKISINERCECIGTNKAMGLLGLHVFSGADWGGKFFGISKKKWITSYLALEPNSEVIDVFQQLGDSDLDLARSQKVLESFVCSVYSATTHQKSLAELRWELFSKRNLEGEKLPPTKATFSLHLQRANYIAKVGKGYRNATNNFPPLSRNGWKETEEGCFVPVQCTELPAPQAVIALLKCGCQGSCLKTKRCSCNKNGMLCTPLCKCVDCDNTKDYDVSEMTDAQDEEEL